MNQEEIEEILMTNSIDIETYKKAAASNPAPVLIDVRRSADHENSPRMLPGAAWRDPLKIDDWIQSLSPENAIVAYCVKGGPVSQSVVNRLKNEGFKAAFLEGGINAWIADGYPVE